MTMCFADIFSGCGGLSHGFTARRGFQIRLAADVWKWAEAVFKRNFSKAPFRCADLSTLQEQDFIIRLLQGKCDILLGGPPCQGFSTLGKRRDNDARSTLIDVFAKIALGVKPKLIIVENVRGITSKMHPSGKTYSETLIEALSPEYYTDARLVNCMEFGLAQTRIRWILVALRRDLPESDKLLPTFWRHFDSKKTKRRRTVRDAIGNLPIIPAGGGNEELIVRRRPRRKIIFNHKAMKHSRELLARLSRVPAGGGLLDVPDRLLTPHLIKMKRGHYGNGGHVKNIYGRLEWDKPSGTIVAGIDKITCGRFIHPESDRLLTPRECARLQSFPDSFVFSGSAVTQYYLIGNAVPPKISGALAFASALVLSVRRNVVSLNSEASKFCPRQPAEARSSY